MRTTLDLTTALADVTGFPPQVAGAVAGILPAAAVRAKAGVTDHFRTGIGPDGVSWRALAFPRPSGGTQPLRDQGLLEASVTARVEGDTIVLRASHPGARTHQYGAVIRPVRAKSLAIPVSREAARVASPRTFGRSLAFVPGRKGGNAVGRLVEDRGGRRQPKTHYILVRSVKVPRRMYLGFSRATVLAITELATGAATTAVREGP